MASMMMRAPWTHNNVHTVVEVTETHIKLLQFRMMRDLPVITALEVCPISGLADDEIEDQVKTMMSGKRIAQERLTLILPRRQILVKRLRLPSQDDEEIKRMVPLQLVDLIHQPLSEVTYSHQVLDREAEGYCQVIVYIVPHEVNLRFANFFRKAQCHPERYVLSSNGILEWFLEQKDMVGVERRSPFLLVDVDHAHTELCFIHDRKLRFSRSVNYGLKHVAGGDHTVLLEHIDVSLKAYRKERLGPENGRIVLLAPSEEGVRLRDALVERFDLTVNLYSPAEMLSSAGQGIPDHMSMSSSISLSAGLGMVFGNIQNVSNLVAEDKTLAYKRRDDRRKVLQMAGLLVATVLFGSGILGTDLFFKMRQLGRIESRIRGLKTEVDMARKEIAQLEALDGYFSKRVLLSSLFQKLQAIAPPEVFFRTVEMSGDGELTISGFAQSSAAVSAFQSRLIDSEVFCSVQWKFSTKRAVFNGEYAEFQIQSRLKQQG